MKLLKNIKNIFKPSYEQDPAFALLCSLAGRAWCRTFFESVVDRRAMLQQAALALKIDENALLNLVGRSQAVTVLTRVLPVDPLESPQGIWLDYFEQFGAIPTVSCGCINGIVCSNLALLPLLLRQLGMQTKSIPLYLASWSLIQAALLQSKNQTQLSSVPQANSTYNKLLPKIMGLLLDEAISFGSNTLRIDLSRDKIEYVIVLTSGRIAKGNIDQRLRQNLLEYLNKINSAGLKFNFDRNGVQNVVQLYVREESRVFELFWHEVGEKPSAIEASLLAQSEKFTAGSQVLIIDDNPVFARVLDKFLSRHSISSLSVQSVEQAFEMLSNQSSQIGLVICDVHMPQQGGLQFTERFRSEPKFAELPLLILTSDEDVEVEIKLISAGADGFITKNEDPRVLCAYVQRLLRSQEARQAA